MKSLVSYTINGVTHVKYETSMPEYIILRGILRNTKYSSISNVTIKKLGK